MNRKKKAKILLIEDVSDKRQKQMLSTLNKKGNSKVFKTKQKLKLKKSDTEINNSTLDKLKAKKNASTSKKKVVPKKVVNGEVEKSANKRGRRPKVVQVDDAKKHEKIQKKSEHLQSEIAAKPRPKGRPRLKTDVKEKRIRAKPLKVNKKSTNLPKKNEEKTKPIESRKVAEKKKKTEPSTKEVMSKVSKDKKSHLDKVKEKKEKHKKVTPEKRSLSASNEKSTSASPSVISKNKTPSNSSVDKSKDKAKSRKKGPRKKANSTRAPKPVKKGKLGPSKSFLSNKKKRGHRVASLNASAKVKALCESDRDSFTTNKATLSNIDFDDNKSPQKESKTTTITNKQSPKKSIDAKKANATSAVRRTKSNKEKREKSTTSIVKPKRKGEKQKSKEKLKTSKVKKGKKVKRNIVDKDVEIIDTRRCKRMASLNASAMMAATYLPETRIVKYEPQQVSQPSYEEPLSSVSEIIEQVVSNHWSRTLEQHIEISPSSSKKTTVKTTVKHVKLRENGTVVETISTQFEEQNILPDAVNLKKSSSQRKSHTKQRSRNAGGSSVSESSSAFTPCSSTSSYLGSNSLSLYTSNSSHTLSPSEQSKKRSRSKAKEKQSSSEHGEQHKKSRSIIRKFEMKTIETRTVNESSSSSMLPNNVIFANNSSASLVNPNYLPRVSQPPMMSYIYPHQTPFNLIPSASSMHSRGQAENSLGPDSSAALNYINVTPFNSSLFQYQPLGSSIVNPLNPASLAPPISFPFLFSNSAQSFSNSYGLINQRSSHLPVPPLLGLSYLSPSVNPGLYQPSSSVINILPTNASPSSGCALVHRPVPYHPQSGHLAPSITSTMSGLINSSPFASASTSPMYSNLTSALPSTLSQYSSLRSPSVASIRHISVPVAYNQPTVFYPTSVPLNNNTDNVASNPLAAPIPSVLCPATPVQSVQRHSSSKTIHANGSLSSPGKSNSASLSSKLRGSNEASVNSHHIQQLTDMTKSISNPSSSSSSSNKTTSRKADLGKKAPGTNHSNGLSAIKCKQNGQGLSNSNNKTNKLGRTGQAKPKIVMQNGIMKRSGGANDYNHSTKRLKLSSGVERNDGSNSKNALAAKDIQNGNRRAKESQNSNWLHSQVECHGEKSASKVAAQSQDTVTYTSPLASARLSVPPLSNTANITGSLKKNRRPIVHGWSWEGESQERYIFVNNDDQPYLRKCFPAIRHFEGEIIRVRDCVLLKSGPRKTDLPFVAKITALWESREKEMMMSLLWYYRPEHTEIQESYINGEVYASKHRDSNSVACIDDKCYVLTYNEFCRYKRQKMRQLCVRRVDRPSQIVPHSSPNPTCSTDHIPPLNILPELVFCCRKVFDFRQKRIMKNPSFKIFE